MSGLLRAAAQALRGGLQGAREGKAAARKTRIEDLGLIRGAEDRRRQIEEDALRQSILGFNLEQAKSGVAAKSAGAATEAKELAALRATSPEFANLSREAIERQLGERAKPKEPKAPLVIPGSPEDLRIRRDQAKVVADVQTDAARERETGAVKQKIAANQTQIGNIDRALGELGKTPSGVGVWNYLPDAIQQRRDPEGIDVRAEIANIGSMIYHDRSGASVTVSEDKRLQPFIPRVTDSPETVRKKLVKLRAAIAAETGYLSPDTKVAPQSGPSEKAREAARRALARRGK